MNPYAIANKLKKASDANGRAQVLLERAKNVVHHDLSISAQSRDRLLTLLTQAEWILADWEAR